MNEEMKQIDPFGHEDIIEEFDILLGGAYCYAYVTNNIKKSFTRFCFDAKIQLPHFYASPNTREGYLAIFSDSIYSPSDSGIRGHYLYRKMLHRLSQWHCDYIYGFIDCRGHPDKKKRLIDFYESFDELGSVHILAESDNFIIKEQPLLK